MAKKGSGLGTTLILALVIVALSVALAIGISRFDFAERWPIIGPLIEEQPARTKTGPIIVESIQNLNQLATVRWQESVIVTRESGGTRFEKTFFGEKVLLVAAGDVEAGMNLENLGKNGVLVSGETVTIDLPEPEILSTSLDESKTRVYDRDFGLVNVRPDDELVERARDRAVDEIENAARENDILKQAETNAKSSIRSFVIALGFKKVRFEE